MAGKATSMAEFKMLVREALGEIDDLRASIEYDEENMGGALGFIDELEGSVKQLYEMKASRAVPTSQGRVNCHLWKLSVTQTRNYYHLNNYFRASKRVMSTDLKTDRKFIVHSLVLACGYSLRTPLHSVRRV